MQCTDPSCQKRATEPAPSVGCLSNRIPALTQFRRGCFLLPVANSSFPFQASDLPSDNDERLAHHRHILTSSCQDNSAGSERILRRAPVDLPLHKYSTLFREFTASRATVPRSSWSLGFDSSPPQSSSPLPKSSAKSSTGLRVTSRKLEETHGC